VLEVISPINQELGTITVVITHNAAIAGMADRVIHLGDGRIQRVDTNPKKFTPAELSGSPMHLQASGARRTP
jgi:putative ABC transport system ATP-binding protein